MSQEMESFFKEMADRFMMFVVNFFTAVIAVIAIELRTTILAGYSRLVHAL
jgi:hypothetical protein